MSFGTRCGLFIMMSILFGRSTQDRLLAGWLGWSMFLVHSWVVVYYVPLVSATSISGSQTRKSTNIGGTLVLDCFVNISHQEDDSVSHIIEWKKDGIQEPVYLQYDKYPANVNSQYYNRVKLVNGFSLEISYIRAEDEGWYECSYKKIGASDNRPSNGTWIYLDVNTPPKIHNSSPRKINELQGATIQLFCLATGSPEPEVIWRKDGVELSNSLRLEISADKSELTIVNLERSDGGIYSCTFRNILGEVTQQINLIVEGAAYILTSPVNMTVLETQPVLFRCGADAFPNNITYRWYFKGQNVLDLPGYGNRIKIRNSGDLEITSVLKDDMGWYTCRPTNGIGKDPEASAFLNVTYVPKIKNMPSHLTWALGLQAKLDCPVDANPPATEFLWNKNNVLLDFQSNKMTLLPNGSLLIYQVQTTDQGSYSCIPISGLGTGPASPLVQVFVKDPPQFRLRPQETYVRVPAEDITLPCSAIGTPTPTITWRKVGSVLQFDGRIFMSGGNLTLRDLRKDDHGQYECEAVNEVAKMVVTTKLILQMTTPHAPYNVTVKTSWFNATIKWIPAYNGGSPQFYVLWYRSINGEKGAWNTLTVFPSNATSFTVYKLKPDTLYEFKILSRNVYGNGTYSDVVQARTLGDTGDLPTTLPLDGNGQEYIPTLVKPIGERPYPPLNVTAVNENSGVRISWTPAKNHLTVNYYVIEKRTANAFEALSDIVKPPDHSYFFRNVEPSTTYYFRIFAYSVMSYSQASNVAAVTTPAAEPVGVFLSQAEIGGIVGGLLFLLVAVILVVVAIICSKKKGRHRGDKYGNVKYIGPADELDTHINRTKSSSEWSTWEPFGRAGSLNSVALANGMFVVPYSNVSYREDTLPVNDYFNNTNPSTFQAESYFYDSDRGPKLTQIRAKSRRKAKNKREIDADRLTQSASATLIGHAVDDQNDLDHHHYVNISAINRTAVSDRPSLYRQQDSYPVLNVLQTQDLSVSHKKKKRRKHLFDHLHHHQNHHQNHHDHVSNVDGYEDTKYGDDDENGFLKSSDDPDGDENGFRPHHLPLPEGYRIPHRLDYDGSHNAMDHSFPGDADDVFLPSAEISRKQETKNKTTQKQTFPRHSSMKPSSYQTYLLGDTLDESFLQPFEAQDISSVHPSFSERAPHYFPGVIPSYSSMPGHRDLSWAQGNEYPSLVMPRYDHTFMESPCHVAPHRSSFSNASHFNGHSHDSTVIERSDAGHNDNTLVAANETQGERTVMIDSDSIIPGSTVGYTRDQLQGTVDRLRKGPRARRAKSTSRLPPLPSYQEATQRSRRTYLSDSVLPQQSRSASARNKTSSLQNGASTVTNMDSMPAQTGALSSMIRPSSPWKPDTSPVPTRTNELTESCVHHGDFQSVPISPTSPHGYAVDIAPYKHSSGQDPNRNSVSSSGRGSFLGHQVQNQPQGSGYKTYLLDDNTPDSISSGIGSKNTSQATGSSVLSRFPKNHPSSISSLTAQEYDFSGHSSPFLDDSSRSRRETSADDQYEFDAIHGVDPEMLEALQKYSGTDSLDDELFEALESGLSTSEFYNNLYPKPTKQSCYDDSEARFQKLRQEFRQYREKQHERSYEYSGNYVPGPMDSEML